MYSNTDYAALVLRIGLGAMFLAHGLLKLLVFTLPGTIGFFEQVGFPGWTAYIVTFAEIGGGIASVFETARSMELVDLIKKINDVEIG